MLPWRHFALCAIAFGACARVTDAAPAIFPLKDIRAGQHGIGRTVFSGSHVEQFDVEILGILENIAPGQSIILGRLKGGPLENTGVMQGMSGSPVYIDGRLAGAVALSFPFAKDAIAGIRPIEDMFRVEPETSAPTNHAAIPRQHNLSRDTRLEEIATPVSFSGFTAATLEHFAPQLREMGLDPRQGVSGGGKPSARMGDPKNLEPGSMISVQLLSGDYSISADGTLTCIDGNRVYAFGHRFLASGPTEMPFAKADVLTLLPNLSSSFKISAAREWMGVITVDRSAAISGILGRRAAMAPIEIRVGGNTYRMEVVQDKVMTPLVAQMALFSAIDATERSIGSATFSVRGELQFEGGAVHVDNVYSGDVAQPAIAALGLGTPLSYAMGSGFDAFRLKGIKIDVGIAERRNQMQISDISAPRNARPGEAVEIVVTLSGENGAERTQKVRYQVPVGAPLGNLSFTVADAASSNLLDFGAMLNTPYHSPGQMFDFLNGLRPNTRAYLRVWRNDPAYSVEGRDLPAPPPSVAMLLARAQTQTANLVIPRGSKVAEIEIPTSNNVVSGSKTVQVEIKE